MALSGKVGASASGLKIQACTASLNFETCASSLSAESLSTTSQPVSSVSAPRLAPPEMKRRRVMSGISLVASLTRSVLSTPGIKSLRKRPMIVSSESSGSAADDHGAQALRHQDRKRDVNDEECHDRRHAEEVHVTGLVVIAEQRHQP